MKTTSVAVNKVYSILKQLGGLSCPVYKYTKPTTLTLAEYAVVNSLPITGGVLQICRVNVNFHVKDLADGIPNVARLEIQSTFIMGLIEQVNDNALGIYIDIEDQNIEQSEKPGEHYSNFRLVVKILNK